MDDSIIGLQLKISAVVDGSPQSLKLRHRLALLLYDKYQTYGHAADDLAAAISQATIAVDNADDLEPAERDEMAVHLAQMVFQQHDQLKTPESLEAALERGLQTTSLLCNSSPYLPTLWHNMARLLINRGKFEDEYDLEAALKYAEDAADHHQKDDFEYPCFLYTIAEIQFRLSCLRSRQDDLEKAILQALASKKAMRIGHPMERKVRGVLSQFYVERYSYTRDGEDWFKASLYVAEFNSMPPSTSGTVDDQRLSWMDHLRRFRLSGQISDLDEAISQTRNYISCLAENSSEKASAALVLAELFNIRFIQLGEVKDARDGIFLAKEALALAFKSHTEPIGALHCLSWSLVNHNNELDVIEDVEDTIKTVERIQPLFIGGENYASLLTTWGMMLKQRFQHDHQNVRAIEEGMAKLREALKLPQSEEDRIGTLDVLTGCLHDHFNRTGDEDSMNEAVTTGRQLVSLTSQESRQRNQILVQLARQLANRFFRTGNLAELDEAISIYEGVDKALPEHHFLRLRNSDALSILYNKRFERRGLESDNEKAIAALQQCIGLTTPGSQERAVKLLNLGSGLWRRFSRKRSPADLKDAMSRYEEALKTQFTKPNQDVKSSCLSGLAQLRYEQYKLTGDTTLIANSVEECKRAVAALTQGHPKLATAHYVLGGCLEQRAEATGMLEDIDAALDSFKTACDLPAGEPHQRIISARRAMRILGGKQRWVEAEPIADLAVSLIPRACTRKLTQDDQLHALHDISETSTEACSISLRVGNVGKALQHIEFGRGLVLGYLIDGQNDLSDLRQRDSSLAHEYESLRARVAGASTGLDEIYQELDNCEGKIRQIEGFERFLLSPSLDELQAEACGGPIVVVNLSSFGADAIIVTKDNLQTLGLPGMTVNSMSRVTVAKMTREGRERDMEPEQAPRLGVEMLEWLWSSCVHPILNKITEDVHTKPNGSSLRRIWWIGTGFASTLPFHAATSSDGSTLDLSIPSYTSTIKALQNARKRSSKGHKTDDADPYHLLMVTMPSTPSQTDLPGVTREKQAIKAAVKDNYTITELEHPNAQQVLDGMQNAQIVHFACHGASDPKDPLQSHLLLQKSDQTLDKLTVKSLLAAKVKTRAWIAYLSACSTAEVKAFSLKDEGLHATSAFQVSGFGHVIGSLWPVSDKVSIEVARLFYEFLSRPTTKPVSPDRLVAGALRSAVLEIRTRYPDNADIWGPYIHYGA
ncbi:hypothetical protein CFIO01_11422 [Colletotrichum fioriniae PJ7]|uniref:CHAT domain-containing protein n=1 Tax=Colletotrichum fioriniae PJ7 TaxID=1445577 RepID=A0A010RQD5_9PEZI|nr:hypothetical protein CFIO01_11422 [Colletotrichum fioriniae PJ7]